MKRQTIFASDVPRPQSISLLTLAGARKALTCVAALILSMASTTLHGTAANLPEVASAPAVGQQDKPIEFTDLLQEMGSRESLARWPEIEWKNLQDSALKTDARHNPGSFGVKQIGNFVRIEEKENGRKEWVLMDYQGPGVVMRMWSPNMAKDAILRIYFDGSSKPALEVNMMKFFYGEDFVKPPFALLKARGGNVYLPIPFAKACKITVDTNFCGWAPPPDLFYDIQYRVYAPGTKIKTFDMADYEANEKLLTQIGYRLENGQADQENESEVLNTNIDTGRKIDVELKPGSTALNYLSIQLDAADITNALRSTVMKIKFDGMDTVDCPIGDFFGSGYGLNPFHDWMRTVSKDGKLTCHWVMPYQKSAKLSLENAGNDSIKVSVSAGYEPWTWDDRSMYFHANWRLANNISDLPVTNFNFIKIKGRGVYVGDTLSVKNNSPKWWGEGPEKVTVDDDAFPSQFGTGTEDYFGYAWGDTEIFEAPFIAQPRIPSGPGFVGTTVNTRIRSLDGIPFRHNFNLDLEVLTQGAMIKEPTTLDYGAATFWYGFVQTAKERLGRQ